MMNYLKDVPGLPHWFREEDEGHMEQSKTVTAKPS